MTSAPNCAAAATSATRARAACGGIARARVPKPEASEMENAVLAPRPRHRPPEDRPDAGWSTPRRRHRHPGADEQAAPLTLQRRRRQARTHWERGRSACADFRRSIRSVPGILGPLRKRRILVALAVVARGLKLARSQRCRGVEALCRIDNTHPMFETTLTCPGARVLACPRTQRLWSR